MDHGYHVFYLAQQLLQATPSAFQVDRYHCDPTTGIEDVITVSGEFAKNGKKQAFRASFSWVAESRSTVYQIEGTQGSIRIEDATMLVNTRKHASTFVHQEGLTASSQHPVWFRALFQRFLEAHRTHVVFHDDLRTACYAMEAIWTSYQCMQHGRTIPIQTEGWSSYFERP
jgi:predicted dehydrogenase